MYTPKTIRKDGLKWLIVENLIQKISKFFE